MLLFLQIKVQFLKLRVMQLVNPTDIDSLADVIFSVLSDDSVTSRLIERGLKRVQVFSWEKNARERISVFKQVFNGW